MTDKLRRLFKKQRKHKIRFLKDALTKHKTRIPGEYLMDLSDHLPDLVKNDDHNNNAVETLVYIEKKVAIKFVRVQVVDLPSHKYPNGQEDKQLVEFRKHLIGQELLVPITFPCTVTQINRSFHKSICNSIEQLPDPLPSSLTLEEDCELPLLGQATFDKKQKGARFKVVKTCKDPVYFIILQDFDGKYYSLREDTNVKFSFLPLMKKNNLSEYIETATLPRLVVLSRFTEEEVIVYDSATFKTLSAAFLGPVKILSVEEFSCFVGWVRHTRAGKDPDAALLIPENPVPAIRVRKVSKATNKTSIQNEDFQKRYFDKLTAARLYTKDLNQHAITHIGQVMLQIKREVQTENETHAHEQADEENSQDDVLDHDYVNFPKLSARQLITSLTLARKKLKDTEEDEEIFEQFSNRTRQRDFSTLPANMKLKSRRRSHSKTKGLFADKTEVSTKKRYSASGDENVIKTTSKETFPRGYATLPAHFRSKVRRKSRSIITAFSDNENDEFSDNSEKVECLFSEDSPAKPVKSNKLLNHCNSFVDDTYSTANTPRTDNPGLTNKSKHSLEEFSKDIVTGADMNLPNGKAAANDQVGVESDIEV